MRDSSSLIEILVVDDDEVTRHLLREVLEREGFRITLAESGEQATTLIQKRTFPIVLSDIRMLELDGLAVLKEAKKRSQATAVLLMTGFGCMDGAIDAVRAGAFDYVSKPFKLEQMLAAVHRAARHWDSLAGEAMRRAARDLGGDKRGVDRKRDGRGRELVGRSPKIVEVYKTLAHATLSRSSVLVRGESGTGKGLVARAIHEKSDSRSGPFVTWSGPPASGNPGLEEGCGRAGHGTLYLEEVGQLSPAVQAELLHLLEEDRLKARVIAATQLDLEAEVRSGRFREDLLYRLKVISISLPPLRDRLEDIEELVDLFVSRHSERNSKNVSHVSPDALELFRKYSWPGNIRELEHVIERAVVLTTSAVLIPEDFAPLMPQPLSKPADGSLEELEKQAILRVLGEVRFNKSRASEVLGIDRATLYRKAQRHGIDLRGR